MRRAELNSEELIEYLNHRGWTLMKSKPNIAILRKAILDQEEEIVLPRDREFADYQQRVLEAIRFLAKQEQRQEQEIIEEVLSPKCDVLRIRIKGNQIGYGSIPFLDKGTIEEGVRKVLFASARFVIDPKPYFKKLYLVDAQEWMQNCRATLPESGSYVLKIQLPLREDPEGFETPFSRRVGEYLMNSLNQLVEGIDSQGDFSMEKEKSSLNANLCLGLAEMKPNENPIHFDFEMKWSHELPMKKKIPSKVEIHDHHFPAIMRIGQKLKPKGEENQGLFIGKILSLQGLANEQGNMEGDAILSLLIDEESVKAKVLLNSDFYSIACDAHKLNKYIQVGGVLLEKPRCSDLKNISVFETVSC